MTINIPLHQNLTYESIYSYKRHNLQLHEGVKILLISLWRLWHQNLTYESIYSTVMVDSIIFFNYSVEAKVHQQGLNGSQPSTGARKNIAVGHTNFLVISMI